MLRERSQPERVKEYILYGPLYGVSEHVKLSYNDGNHINGCLGWGMERGIDQKGLEVNFLEWTQCYIS